MLLSGGSLSSSSLAINENGATGTFTQSGGTNTIGGSGLRLSVGQTGGSSSYTMSGGLLNGTGALYIGYGSGSGASSTFEISGSAASVAIGNAYASGNATLRFLSDATGVSALNLNDFAPGRDPNNLNNLNLTLDFTAYAGSPTESFNIMKFASAPEVQTFASESITGLGVGSFTEWRDSGRELWVVAIPEPSSFKLMSVAAAFFGLLMVRRHQRRAK
jgi:hypothetical protein